MKKVIINLALLVLLSSASMVFAVPNITATADETEYTIGDTLTLNVDIAEISAYRGLFFELNYKSEALSFEGVSRGDVILNESKENDLLFAKSEHNGNRIIISYSLIGADSSSVSNGRLLQIHFKVTGNRVTGDDLLFTNNGIQDQAGAPLAGITWNVNADYSVFTPPNTSFISIKSPYENQVFYEDTIKIDSIFSATAAYTVKVSNLDNAYVSAALDATSGFVAQVPVTIKTGYNRIVASLYDELNVLVAQDRVRVYKSDDTEYIKIVSPAEHSLVNRNIVKVHVESPFSTVSINGSMAASIPGVTLNNNFKKYEADVWLKDGYNRVVALAVNEIGAIFQHSIVVYYQQDGETFELVKPYEGQIFKNDGVIDIVGEISSLSTTNPANQNIQDRNTVHYSLIHYPSDSLHNPFTIVRDEPANIVAAELSEDYNTPYLFKHTINLSDFTNMNKGKLELKVTLNKYGSATRELTRFINLDNSWLKIDLTQPNIFGQDLIDTQIVLNNIDPYSTDPLKKTKIDNIDINNKGDFVLSNGQKVIKSYNNPVIDKPDVLYQMNNGDFYGLDNSLGSMRLLKKDFGATTFATLLEKDIHGYAMKEIEEGLLIGVSNLYTSSNSGLYLYKDGKLMNVRMEAPISFVQFIENINGQIYLYGHNYSSVYSFNTKDLEEKNGIYNVSTFEKSPISISGKLKEMKITNSGNSLLALSDLGELTIFQKGFDNRFEMISISDGIVDKDNKIEYIVTGENKEGVYNTYLLINRVNNQIVMENKLTGRFSVNNFSSIANYKYKSMESVGYNGENFVFAYPLDASNNLSNFQLDEVTIFFDEVKLIESTEFNNIDNTVIQVGEYQIYVNNQVFSFIGKSNASGWPINSLQTVYDSAGSASINYWNPIVDGVRGFSFYIDPMWFNSNNVLFGFSIGDLQVNEVKLSDLLNYKDGISVQHFYDTITQKEYVYIEFTELEIISKDPVILDSDVLKFNFSMAAETMISPSISGITVYRKSPFRLFKSETNLSLPIQGHVYDPTVGSVRIGQANIQIDKNRKFSYNYPLVALNSGQTVPVDISCTNSSGDNAQLSFNIEILDSYNGLSSVLLREFKLVGEPELRFDKDILIGRPIEFSGSYYGLKDCIVGYELYKGSNSDISPENLITSAILNKDSITYLDNVLDVSPFAGVSEQNKNRYEAGTFLDSISFNPGKQTIKLYVENEGGKRSYLSENGRFPQFFEGSNLSGQRVTFSNYGLKYRSTIINGIKIEGEINIDVSEESIPPYSFTKDYTLTGQIHSVYDVSEVIAKSSHENILFENKLREIKVTLKSDKTFDVPLTISLLDDELEFESYISIVPTDPVINIQETGVILNVVKNFEDSHIEPDFTLLKSFNWTKPEKKGLKKAAYLNFAKLMPHGLNGVQVSLLVNYEKYISGSLDLVDQANGLYRLLDIYGNQVYLEGVRPGKNTIYWSLSYKGYIISSSDNPYMDDFELNLDFTDLDYQKTEITVSPLTSSCISAPINLPYIDIKKDETTILNVYLNGNKLDYSMVNSQILESDTIQGKNILIIEYIEKLQGKVREEFAFTYDSIAPLVELESITFVDINKTKANLSVLIREANLQDIEWEKITVPESGYNKENLSISYVTTDVYRAVISDLDQGDQIRIKAFDPQTNTISETFTVESLVSDISAIVPVQLEKYTQNEPAIQNELEGSLLNTPFPVGHNVVYSKFYSSSIELGGINFTNHNGNFKMNRSELIRLSSKAPAGDTSVSAKIVHLDPNFSVPLGAIFISENNLLINQQKVYNFTHEKQSNNMTLSFWFRYEHEAYYLPIANNPGTNPFFPVLELSANLKLLTNEEGTSLYLNSPLNMVPISNTGWNFISIIIKNGVASNDGEVTLLSKKTDGTYAEFILTSYDTAELSTILDAGSIYTFGDSEAGKSGHFSIAYPNYIDRLLTYKNTPSPALDAIYTSTLTNGSVDALFDSSDYANSGDSGVYKSINNNEIVTVSSENVQFKQFPNSAILATKGHQNLLAISEQDEISFAMEELESQGETDNLAILREGDYLNLYVENLFIKGRYYFGKKRQETARNFLGLNIGDNNEPYTISGAVLPQLRNGEELPVDSRIILSVNGRETIYELEKGDFRISFKPSDLDLRHDSFFNIILESDHGVQLKRELILNKGNFKIPFSGEKIKIEQAVKRDNFLFQLEGAIEFWYKPFNVNQEGFSNYDTVLFDSESFKIYSELDNGVSKYRVKFLSDDVIEPWKTITTTTPVFAGWNHIQLSYTTEGVGEIVLTINGKYAGKASEKASLISTSSSIYFGCSKDNTNKTFAEGFIDDIEISPLYQGGDYRDFSPLAYEYKSVTNTLEINPLEINLLDIESVVYTLESSDRDFKKTSFKEGGDVYQILKHDFDISKLNSGRYKFHTVMKINGYNYENTYYFMKHDRPTFILKDTTPFVIANETNKLEFRLLYDMPEMPIEKKLSAVALRIIGRKTDGQTFLETKYIVHRNDQWLSFSTNDVTGTTETGEILSLINNLLPITFTGLDVGSEIKYEIKPFYVFEGTEAPYFDDAQNMPEWISETIEEMDLNLKIEKLKDGTEYKIVVSVVDQKTNIGNEIIENLTLNYSISSIDNSSGINRQGTTTFSNSNGIIQLYYDDIIPSHGKYRGVFTLLYMGNPVLSKTHIINSEKPENLLDSGTNKNLRIDEFSVVSVDNVENKARLYIRYSHNAIYGDISYLVDVYQGNTKMNSSEGTLIKSNNSKMIDVIVPSGDSLLILKLSGSSLEAIEDVNAVNNVAAPEIVLINTNPYLITYNNISFGWNGLHMGENNNNIIYFYNLDDKGWVPVGNKKSREFSNLREGEHNFAIKASLNGIDSLIKTSSFLVDTNAPSIDFNQITIDPLSSIDGIVTSLNISGRKRAISDVSLSNLFINNINHEFNDDGSFQTINIPLDFDGLNSIVIEVKDSAGNSTERSLEYENNIIDLIYPRNNEIVEYGPMTLVGKVSSNIKSKVDVYVQDPLSFSSDYMSWKKARINEDKNFFVEGLFINPGKRYRTIDTKLKIAIVTQSGKVFMKETVVKAGELIIPIEMELSSHAIDGESAETQIDIECHSIIDDISSWSIDFNGDGIYDLVDIVKVNEDGSQHSWSHTYATLGSIKPRVRAITKDNKYFSVSDELIVHEQFNQSTNLIVENPKSFSLLRTTLNAYESYILSEKDGVNYIDIYEIGANENSIGDKLERINLNTFSIISNPYKIVVPQEDTIYIISQNSGLAEIHMLKKNNLGVYHYISEAFYLDDSQSDSIHDLTFDDHNLYISYTNDPTITKLPHLDYFPQVSQVEHLETIIPGQKTPGVAMGLNRDLLNVYAADYFNQRVLVFNENMDVQNYFGEFGTAEGQFIKPMIVKKNSGRIFVYDEGRGDVQVFNENYKLITNFSYENNVNHIQANLLKDVAGIEVVTKEESGKLYFYILVLSKSENCLSMVKLPEWDELRVKVKNNRIVFIRDKEIYTAKPNGSDLKMILSTDSFPSIRGLVDYPALGPDGSKLVFVSKSHLYSGESTNISNTEEYDNLYMLEIDDPDTLVKIPLDSLNEFEIERPVFNTNGNKVIFSARKAGSNWQIYIYNMLTGGIEKLFSSSENARFPYYSPDDSYVVFTTDADGDEEIEIIDTATKSVRVEISSNDAKDTLPIWSELYPFEIAVADYNIKSKIAFVSEKDFKKTINYVYLSDTYEQITNPNTSTIIDGARIIKVVTKNGANTGRDPDSARILLTAANEEGDYPCITGDGSSLIFEGQEDYHTSIKETKLILATNESYTSKALNIPNRSLKPAGMKNRISNFDISNVNGNDILLKWDRYTDHDINYYIEFRQNKSTAIPTIVKVFSQNSIVLSDFEMGSEYLFRVFVEENGEEVTSTQLTKFKTPSVVAIPTYEIDKDNPYLVKLNAWKPKADTKWEFTWIVENREISILSLNDYYYEFSTSGEKTILLKAATPGNTSIDISEPLVVQVVSDIKPVIEYNISNDTKYIELDAKKSLGGNINWVDTEWQIDGPGSAPYFSKGSKTIVDLERFKHKIYVKVVLKRISIEGQPNVDNLEKTIVIDLKYDDIKPVITYESNELNERLLTFTGNDSFGNIDWIMAKWQIFADGALLYSEAGVSSFNYLFPETNSKTNYSVSLTVPRPDNNMSESTNIHVTIGPSPIIPEIDYEVLTMEENGQIVGSRILLTCSGSKGSNIDYSQARWNLPIAANYGEQSSQFGPTAVFNLLNIKENALIEISLTLMKRGGSEPVTLNKIISLGADELAPVNISINVESENGSNAEMLVFDILSSTGPNIIWDATTWQFDSITKTGAVVRLDKSYSGDFGLIPYICSVYVKGSTTPIIKRGTIEVEAKDIFPVISTNSIDEGSQLNVFELNVLETSNVGIDWARTEWFIPDGNNNLIKKHGSRIYHVFPFSSLPRVYRIMVNMYYKGDNKPSTGYKSIVVDPNYLTSVIKVENKGDEVTTDNNLIIRNRNIRHFSAEDSLGENIRWRECRWDFGDTGSVAYGKSVMHEFPLSTENKTFEVSLTIYRNLSNGDQETSTRIVDVMISKDYINPVISLTKETDITKPNVYTLSVLDSKGTRIDWSRTRWFINGRTLSGSEVVHEFDNSAVDIIYKIKAQMYLLGNTTPFIAEVELPIKEDSLTSIIKTNSDNKINSYIFDGTSSMGYGRQYFWDFGDGTNAIGGLVPHQFPVIGQTKTYIVKLKVMRNSGSEQEVSISQINHTVEGFALKPKITHSTRMNSDNLNIMKNQIILSAMGTENSEYVDFMRTVWTGVRIIDDKIKLKDRRDVVKGNGPELMHMIPLEKIFIRYLIRLEMYLKGDTTPFIVDKVIQIPGFNYNAVIAGTKGATYYDFKAGGSTGIDIDWLKSYWEVTPSEGTTISNDGLGKEVRISIDDQDEHTVKFHLFASSKGESFKVATATQKASIETIKPVITTSSTSTNKENLHAILHANASTGININKELSTWYIIEADSFSSPQSGDKFSTAGLTTPFTIRKGATLELDNTTFAGKDFLWVALEISRTKLSGGVEYSYTLSKVEGYKPAPVPRSSSSSSSSSSSKTCVICTELFNQGRLPLDIFKADEKFGQVMRDKNRFIMVGYHTIAKPIVKWMQDSTKITEIVEVFAIPWANEMAHRMGVRDTGSISGKIVMAVGIPISIGVGFFVSYKIFSSLFLIGMIFIIVLIVRKRRAKNA